MSELISRQKLIEELMECSMVGIGKRNPKGSKEEMLYEDYIKLDTVLELIESQPPADVPDTNVGEWIPCSERPPEEPCFYTVEDHSPYTLKRHGKPRRKVVTVKPYMWDVYDRVVAWKPIDMEPYKGVE